MTIASISTSSPLLISSLSHHLISTHLSRRRYYEGLQVQSRVLVESSDNNTLLLLGTTHPVMEALQHLNDELSRPAIMIIIMMVVVMMMMIVMMIVMMIMMMMMHITIIIYT